MPSEERRTVNEIIQAELDHWHEIALIEDAIRARFPERYCPHCRQHMSYHETFWGSRYWVCLDCEGKSTADYD